MPTKLQIDKNLKLSEKLLDYLTDNPQEHEKNVSYIVITKEDNDLNNENLSMAKNLIKSGRKVIKAIETNSKSTPWKFASI